MRLHFSSTIGILSVEVHEFDTMESIKAKIQMIEPPFTVARQQFSLRNQVLADDKNAIFYQLANDEIIRLIIDPPPPGAYLGEVTSAAADGAAFGGLTGIAFLRDVARNERTVFCADGAGHRVQAMRITLDSEQRPKSTTLCWDHGRVGAAGARAEDELNWPADCALSADQTELWIADSKNHRVKVVRTSDGTFLSAFGENGHGAGQFYTPSALCLSETGGRRWLWVGDDGAHRVQCFDLAHSPPRVIRQLGVTCEAGIYGSPAHVWQPCGIAAIGGRLFVAEYGNDRVAVFDEQSGQRVGQIGGRRGPAPGQLAYPRGIGVDTERNLLYVSDYGNERVSIFRVAPPFAFVGIVPVKAPCGAAIEASLDAAFAPTVFIPQFVGQHISLFAGF